MGQISMNATHIAHGGGSHQHAGDAEDPSHRNLAVAEGVLDGTNGCLDGSTWVAWRPDKISMPTPALRPVDLLLREAEGEKVVTRWTATARHTGEFAGIPATGKRFSLKAINIHRVVDGQIQEGWLEWDALGWMQQLGVIPADA